MIVGGIEDGPDFRAGIRWGDRIVTVNGVDPRNLCSRNPKLTPLTLVIDRGGPRKTFTIELAQAADLLRDNHWQV